MGETGFVTLMDSTFVWDISDFPNKCKAVGECITSPYFAAGDIPLDKIKWCLRLYPFGISADFENCLSLYLCLEFCSDVSEVGISYKFYLWNSNEVNLHEYRERRCSCTKNIWGHPRILHRNDDIFKNHIAMSKDSTLSIACCIKNRYFNSNLNSTALLVQGHLDTFFLSENLSDVTIEVDGKKLKAHKIILSARSEVFLAMFNHDMKESNEGVIKVTDVSYDVMKEVLRYIYCGEVENLDLHSRDLLAAANKYGLLSLKEICNKALMKILNVSNACEILSIFHLHQCSAYKEKTIDFIIQDLKAVIDTEGFKQIKDHSLSSDILRKTALTMSN